MRERMRRQLGRAFLRLGTWLVDLGARLDPAPIPEGFHDRLRGRLGLTLMGDARNGYHGRESGPGGE